MRDSMARQSLRDYIRLLEEKNQLMVCEREVDPRFELGSVIKKYNGIKPMLFNRIKGYNITAAAGICGERARYAELLNTSSEGITFALMDAVANPMPYEAVSTGPVKENIVKRNIDIKRLFPVPTFHEKDSNPFITAGIVVVKDRKTGKSHTSVRRLQVLGGNRLSVLIESPMLLDQYLEMEKNNEPMEIAVILGYDPIFMVASQVNSQIYGLDKYEVDSALRGEPLKLTKCETVDLMVPAYAEIVLEGFMPPHVREKEGPFGEMAGYYGGGTPQPVMEITAVCHRNAPIFQINFPSSSEHVLPNGLMREMHLYQQVKNIIPSVKAVHLPIVGGCRFHAIVSIHKASEGDGKSAIIAAMASNKDVKHVIVVDDDVDIFNPTDVEWAIATRVQADKDVVIIPGARGSGLEPTHEMRGVTAKMGIDATAPLGELGSRFERIRMPGWEKIKAQDYFGNTAGGI